MKILYVDDDPELREIAEWALSRAPELDVRMVASGEEALGLIDAGSWIPDVILLDVRMPGLDGPATLRALKRRPALADARYAYVSAARESEHAQLLATGAEAVLTKPFDIAGFAGAVMAIGTAPKR